MAAPVFALVDCNNFFVSCERVFRPDLQNKPVAVLSNNDSCIVARSNEVKALGIPMGVPLFKVRPIVKQHNVTLFSGNFSLYGDFSQRVVQTLQTFTSRIEVYSVDESFLEISDLGIDDYQTWAGIVKERVTQWTGIPVSVGVAPTKTLAKAAAEYAKKTPSTGGVYSLVAGAGLSARTAEFRRQALLQWLPVGDVWGIGWRQAPKMQQIGISTAAQLAAVSDAWAQQHMNILGVKTVHELQGQARYMLAQDDKPQKSIARTRQFGHTVRDFYQLQSAIATFAAQAAVKLRDQQEVTSAVMVYLRTSNAHHEERRFGASSVVHLAQPSADTGNVISAAMRGLERVYDSELGYTKGGVVLLGLQPHSAWQLALWGGESSERIDKQAQLMTVIDRLNERHGARVVRHASEQPLRRDWQSRRELRSPQYTTQWREIPTVKAA